MDCKDLQTYGSAYIDNMLSEEEELDFKNHIKECKICNTAFENLKTVVESTNMIEEIELPANFSDELHRKLQSTKNYKLKSTLFSKGRVLSGIAATLLILVLSLSLVNNFLNYKKGTDFYSGTDNTIPKEESINIDDAHNEVKKKTLNKTDDEEPIMGLRTAPTNDEEEKGNSGEIRENTAGYGREEADGDTGFIAGSNDNGESTVNENEQDISDEKKINKIMGPVVILVLTAGIVILIYKIPRG